MDRQRVGETRLEALLRGRIGDAANIFSAYLCRRPWAELRVEWPTLITADPARDVFASGVDVLTMVTGRNSGPNIERRQGCEHEWSARGEARSRRTYVLTARSGIRESSGISRRERHSG